MFSEELSETDLQSLIDDLTFFIDIHPTFDGKLIDSLINQHNNEIALSKKQIETLLTIHEKWNVSHFLQMKCYGEMIDDELL